MAGLEQQSTIYEKCIITHKRNRIRVRCGGQFDIHRAWRAEDGRLLIQFHPHATLGGEAIHRGEVKRLEQQYFHMQDGVLYQLSATERFRTEKEPMESRFVSFFNNALDAPDSMQVFTVDIHTHRPYDKDTPMFKFVFARTGAGKRFGPGVLCPKGGESAIDLVNGCNVFTPLTQDEIKCLMRILKKEDVKTYMVSKEPPTSPHIFDVYRCEKNRDRYILVREHPSHQIARSTVWMGTRNAMQLHEVEGWGWDESSESLIMQLKDGCTLALHPRDRLSRYVPFDRMSDDPVISSEYFDYAYAAVLGILAVTAMYPLTKTYIPSLNESEEEESESEDDS